ncbi:hypothetical protein BDR26DRAFT_853148 [Obelidium mucronatum]|nr:hypothetical protein BDR26DRAFT_853148 [Obelidium mucronatum]
MSSSLGFLPTEVTQQIFALISPAAVLKYSRLNKHINASLTHRDFAALNLTFFVRDDLYAAAIKTNPDFLARLWFLFPDFYSQVYCERFLKNVSVISWMYKDLSHSIPQSVGCLGHLKVLKLTSNNLSGVIPQSLGNATSLIALDLSDNLLEGPIPSSLGSLASLERLLLQRNHLTGVLPAELGNLSCLKVMYLTKNRFEGVLPPSFARLLQLEDFRADDSGLEVGGIEANARLMLVFSDGFKRLSALLAREFRGRVRIEGNEDHEGIED